MKTVRIVVVTVFLIAISALLAYAGPPLQEPLPKGKTPIPVISTPTEPVPFFGPQPYALVVSGAGELGQSGGSVPTMAFSSDSFSVDEGASTATITVILNAASGHTVTVDYATSDGPATAGDDYTATSGTLTLNPGVTSRTFSVDITDDALGNGDETVTLTLSNASNATIGGNNPATLTILDDEALLQLVANGDFEAGRDGSWTEYSKNGWPLIVNSSTPNMVTPHSGNWAAWLGGDYNEVSELSQQVSIPAGATSLSLTYWYWISSEDACGYDHGWFEVNGTKLKNYALCSSHNTGGWVKETVNFDSYAGQTVTIKFHVDTDDTLLSNFFLDDVALTGTPPPPSCTVLTSVTINGATSGVSGQSYTFTAVVSPTDASTPIIYNWSPEPSSGQGTNQATYTWNTAGNQTISVSVSNCNGNGTANDNHTTAISGKVYLPIVMRGYCICGPDNYEPNDSFAQAYGPLTSGQTYPSYISCCDVASQRDYFYIDINTTNTINIDLTNIPAGTDYDLYLYNASQAEVARSWNNGNLPEHISYNPPGAGRYYILVFSPYFHYSTSPYSLRVTYD